MYCNGGFILKNIFIKNFFKSGETKCNLVNSKIPIYILLILLRRKSEYKFFNVSVDLSINHQSTLGPHGSIHGKLRCRVTANN